MLNDTPTSTMTVPRLTTKSQKVRVGQFLEIPLLPQNIWTNSSHLLAHEITLLIKTNHPIFQGHYCLLRLTTFCL